MRHLFAFFLSIFLCFNAAHAAVKDICDLVEHGSGGLSGSVEKATPEHFDHHSHDHEHSVVDQDQGEAPDQNPQSAHADHSHPHPCFTSIAPGDISLPTQNSVDERPIGSVERFVSLPAARFERPPRAALA